MSPRTPPEVYQKPTLANAIVHYGQDYLHDYMRHCLEAMQDNAPTALCTLNQLLIGFYQQVMPVPVPVPVPVSLLSAGALTSPHTCAACLFLGLSGKDPWQPPLHSGRSSAARWQAQISLPGGCFWDSEQTPVCAEPGRDGGGVPGAGAALRPVAGHPDQPRGAPAALHLLSCTRASQPVAESGARLVCACLTSAVSSSAKPGEPLSWAHWSARLVLSESTQRMEACSCKLDETVLPRCPTAALGPLTLLRATTCSAMC